MVWMFAADELRYHFPFAPLIRARWQCIPVASRHSFATLSPVIHGFTERLHDAREHCRRCPVHPPR